MPWGLLTQAGMLKQTATFKYAVELAYASKGCKMQIRKGPERGLLHNLFEDRD
jgi:hypothetical protein